MVLDFVVDVEGGAASVLIPTMPAAARSSRNSAHLSRVRDLAWSYFESGAPRARSLGLLAKAQAFGMTATLAGPAMLKPNLRSE
jgi:hypothetical protein